jgi:hypothetical protein
MPGDTGCGGKGSGVGFARREREAAFQFQIYYDSLGENDIDM